jgi:CheY-like chemotaxis protein
MSLPAPVQRTALAVDIDRPFQHVLAAWLAERGYRVSFVPLAEALDVQAPADLLVCELAEPKRAGAQTLRQLAHGHPGAPLIAMSARFVAGARCDALAHQLGVQAALAKPCSRYDFHAALDAVPMSTAHPRLHDAPRVPPAPRPGR